MLVFTHFIGNPPTQKKITISLLDQKNLFFSMKDNIPIKTMITNEMPTYKIKIGFGI